MACNTVKCLTNAVVTLDSSSKIHYSITLIMHLNRSFLREIGALEHSLGFHIQRSVQE